jgi:hypothetical protein
MESSHEPFSVSFEELDYWETRNRRNNFFELVYILSCAGDNKRIQQPGPAFPPDHAKSDGGGPGNYFT